MGSEGSSPDDECRCGHTRKAHTAGGGSAACNACPGDEERSWRHAFVSADAETAEPEAPDLCEIPHESIEEENECEQRSLAPRRPPYAVAYEIGDGRLYEVALAGDAVATVEDGVLKISHPEGVVHMIQIKPIGEQ